MRLRYQVSVPAATIEGSEVVGRAGNCSHTSRSTLF
jgi:hypothetical protein